ncbi:DNA polymerase [Mesorhizobium sp. WSM4312]|uniref:DNA polymerase n=1 Tax=Mesorhizobium sp. WSM4312 TaxID=2029411 RepID=UPI000BAFE528|nr:DNA polymerase [Mesorhizobium sp. WSM4312]PBB68159.1 DNA polymerase [Mesorhizobium sp. WSM4312]
MGPTTLVFDIETNGLIPEMTTIHSLVIKNTDTGEVFSCTPQWEVSDKPYYTVDFGLRMLMEADVIVGHNIQDFDVPAIQKLFKWFKPKGLIRDTIIMSRLMYADMKDADFRQEKRLGMGRWIKKHLFSKHSLESWGQRMGIWKGDYGEIKKAEAKARGLTGQDAVDYVWGKWSQDMQDYCEQDVEVTDRLWHKLNKKGFSEESIQLEHDVRRVVARQEAYGFALDLRKVQDLHGTLAQRKAELEKALQVEFRPWFRNLGTKTPTIDRSVSQKHFKPIGYETDRKGNFKLDKKTGEKKPIWPKCHYSTDAPYTDVKLVPFNPGSRQDVADRMRKLFGWRPTEFTSDGHPKVDDETLKGLTYPSAKVLCEYFVVQKRIGQVAEGKEAWLKHEVKGRVHGKVATNGAVTGRMTHSKPNMAQVPGIHDKKTGELLPYGYECRECWTVGKGKKLVGCDADALELRDLAGYMAAYDGGAYIKTVLEGNKANGTDMHTINAKALGCSRDVAKVWFYAFIYGSGDENLGNILGITSSKAKAIAAGKLSRQKFLAALPALGKLSEAVQRKAKTQGWIKGLDGRILMVRSAHASLNTLLQSAGAIQMKRALVILDNNLQALGLVPGVNYEFVVNVHDEWQIEVDEDKAELVGKEAQDAIRLAGEYYKFRCPLAGNSVVGTNWAETH